MKIYYVIPVFDDWESLENLLQEISKLTNYEHNVIVVNDFSTKEVYYNKDSFANINLLKILNLKINVSHQRAIAIGLQYVYTEIVDYDYLVVMDADGEDIPQQIPLLLNKAIEENQNKIVFAKRKKRQESLMFIIGYFIYKKLFKFLTDQEINFGNYSVIPKKLLEKVIYQNNLWNHYSGTIIQSKIPYTSLELDRGIRYQGKSKMNLNSLILHGLSSIAINFDYMSVKILKLCFYTLFVCVIGVFIILYQKLFTDTAIPGWASSLILIIIGIIVQLFTFTGLMLMIQLQSRKDIKKPDSKIYKKFVHDEI